VFTYNLNSVKAYAVLKDEASYYSMPISVPRAVKSMYTARYSVSHHYLTHVHAWVLARSDFVGFASTNLKGQIS
jgi:hypothetical protein